MSKNQPPLLAGLSRNTYLLTLASFFADVSTEMLYPVLPLFLAQFVKNPAGYVGLIEGLSTAGTYLVQGFSGWLADLTGRKKPIALAGYALSALAKPLIGAAVNWPQILVARFGERLGSGLRSAPRDGLIAQSADEKNRGKAFGLEGIGDNLGAVVGPLLAAYLIFQFRVELRLIFFLAFLPAVLAFLATLFVREETQSNRPLARPGLVNIGLPRSYWKYLLVTAIFGLGNSSNAFLILQARNLGASVAAAILIYGAFNLVSALISLPAGTLSDRFGRQKILLFSFAVFGVTYAGFAVSNNLTLITGLFVLYGLFAGVFRTVGKSFATDFVAAKHRATAVGIYSSTIGLTGLIASLGAGVLWETFGPWAAFVLGLATSILGGAALVLLI